MKNTRPFLRGALVAGCGILAMAGWFFWPAVVSHLKSGDLAVPQDFPGKSPEADATPRRDSKDKPLVAKSSSEALTKSVSLVPQKEKAKPAFLQPSSAAGDPKMSSAGSLDQGAKRVAKIKVGSSERSLQPDEVGDFQRIFVDPGQTIPIEMTYPEGEEGQEVVVQAADGGLLDNHSIAKVARLDSSGKLVFQFQTSIQPGTHRVFIRKGADQKTFDFWVGEDFPVAVQ